MRQSPRNLIAAIKAVRQQASPSSSASRRNKGFLIRLLNVQTRFLYSRRFDLIV